MLNASRFLTKIGGIQLIYNLNVVEGQIKD